MNGKTKKRLNVDDTVHFRLHRMHEMQTRPTVTEFAMSVSQSVCHAAQLGFTVQEH